MARTLGALSITVTGDVGTLDQADLTNSNPLWVAVTDANGDQITSFGGGTQYNADSIAGAADTGNVLLAVRSNVISALKVANGDYVQLRVDQGGALWVRTNTQVITGITGATTSVFAGLQFDLDTINQVNVDTNTGNASAGTQRMILASDQPNVPVNVAAATTSVLAGTRVVVTGSLPAGTNAIGKLSENSGVTIGDVAVISITPGTAQASIAKAVDNIATSADVGVAPLVVRSNVISALKVANGDYTHLRVDQGGALWVRTNTMVVTGALPIGTNRIGTVVAAGAIADDSPANTALTDRPLILGGIAKAFDATAPGNVSAEDDIVRGIFDMNRRQYVNTVHPEFWSFHTDVAATATAISGKSIQAAPGANESIFVTDVVISTSAVTGGVEIVFLEGSTNILGPYFFENAVTGRGAVIQFKTPKQITANTALLMTAARSGVVNCQYVVDVTGFIARIN